MSDVSAWAVIPAGGIGSRFTLGLQEGLDRSLDKLLEPLAGKPVLVRSVEALLSASSVKGATVVAHADRVSEYREVLLQAGFQKPVDVVCGGETRRDSVYNGLKAVPEDIAVVAIHDAARPLIEPDIVQEALSRVIEEDHVGSLVALAVHDTVKQVSLASMTVEKTLDRASLWRAQTPQVFDLKIILKAHEMISTETVVTDDVQLVELAGLGSVAIVRGSERNLKITTPEDMRIAEALLSYRLLHQQ